MAGARSSPRLSQIQKMKAAKRAELAAVSKFSQVEEEDNREGKARAATGPLIAVPDPNFFFFKSELIVWTWIGPLFLEKIVIKSFKKC